MKDLWEILVPTTHQDGRPIKTKFHRVWDEQVRKVSHGLTIMSPVKGQWIFKEELFEERMIPVRLIATREQVDEIVKMTLKYYDQLAVLAYKIADDVILRHRDGEGDIG